MSELVTHDCPVEGGMMIEKDKHCNWCDVLDDEPKPELIKNNDRHDRIKLN